MSKVNVLLAINVNQVEQFLDNWRFDANNNRIGNDFAPFNSGGERSPTIDVYNRAHCSVPMKAQGFWKNRDIPGPSTMQLVSIYVADIVELDWTDPQDPDPDNVLTVVHYLRETFPGGLQVLGAFDIHTGVHHGETLIPAVLDEEGNEITPEQVTGNPTYPKLPQANWLEYMPDVDGVPATQLSNVNRVLGHADRRY